MITYANPKQLVARIKTFQWKEYNDEITERQLLIVSPDSTIIVTCDLQDIQKTFTLQVWDRQTLKILGRSIQTNNHYILGIEISPNNQWILCRTAYNVTVLETFNLNNLPRMVSQKNFFCLSAIFSSESKYVLFCGNQIMMYNINDKIQNPITLKCTNINANSLKCGKHILTCVQSNLIKVWNTQPYLNIHSWLTKWKINDVSLSRNDNGKILMTIGKFDTIKMWSTQTRKLIRKYGKFEYEPGNVDLSPNGQLMISYRHYQDCLLWDIISGKCIILESKYKMKYEYKFTPDGKQIIRSSASRRAKVWDIDMDQYFIHKIQQKLITKTELQLSQLIKEIHISSLFYI